MAVEEEADVQYSLWAKQWGWGTAHRQMNWTANEDMRCPKREREREILWVIRLQSQTHPGVVSSFILRLPRPITTSPLLQAGRYASTMEHAHCSLLMWTCSGKWWYIAREWTLIVLRYFHTQPLCNHYVRVQYHWLACWIYDTYKYDLLTDTNLDFYLLFGEPMLCVVVMNTVQWDAQYPNHIIMPSAVQYNSRVFPA